MKPAVNKKTEKMILQKFNKEFMAAIKKVMKLDKVPISMDSYVFCDLLLELNCFQKSDMEKSWSQEFKKVEELWLSLLKASQHPL